MIEPPIDPTTSTDAELVEAYVRNGISRQDAADYVAALRVSDQFPLG